MKKFIAFFCIVSVLATAIAIPSYAAVFTWSGTHGYDVLYYSNTVLNIVQNALASETSSRVLKASPYANSYAYKVVISYDDLSAAVYDCLQSGVIVSLHKNTNAGYWVAYVTDYDNDFIPWTGDDRVGGLLGNVDGYVYVAEIDTTADETLEEVKSISNAVSVIKHLSIETLNSLGEVNNSLDRLIEYADYEKTALISMTTDLLSIINQQIYQLTELQNISALLTAQSTKLDGIVLSVSKLDGIHSEITEPNVSGTLAYNIKTIATKTVNIATQLTGNNTEGTIAKAIADIHTQLTDMDSETSLVFLADDTNRMLYVFNTKLQTMITKLETSNTYFSDIHTLLTNWETSTVDTTALEEKVADTNDYLSTISDKLDDLTESTVENITNITINNDNAAYDVFYLTDENGNEESIAEFGGDVLTAGGKLLNFFFRVAFDDALSNVDTAVDGMTDFYFDSVTVGEGASIWE